MSATNIQRITDAFLARIDSMDAVPDPMGLLSESTEALARDLAETVFFKVQTEPGWTQHQAQALADSTIRDHVLAIADTMRARGGTIEMMQDLAKVAANAYGTRLGELTAAHSRGGRA